SADTWCAAMNWTGSNYNPTFKYKTSPWNGSALYIGGSLTTISGMNWSVVATVNFVGTGTITSAGNSFLSTLNFVTTAGGYSLADNLLVNGVISFTSGQFNTNNYNVTSNGWVSSNNNNRILQTGSSLLFIYNYFSAALTSCFTLGGANLTADFSNATINIRQMVNGYQDAYSFPPTLYKKVLIENPSNYTKTAGSVFLSATGATFDSLCLQSPTSLAGNMTFRKTLQLGSGTYLFGSLNVYTFQPAATISRFGTPGCANLITLANSYPGLTATFAKSSGSLLVDYAKLTYIRTSGAASFVANNSVDLGGNSGWVINTSGVSARTLYWVGNGGNWNDVNHWSLSSGGTPGECVPTRGDSVLFDANSFSLAAQTVTIDITTAECKAMNWTGVTNLPSLAGAAANNMAVYGSLLLSNGMVLTAQCPFVLMGANAHVVQSGGNTFSTAGLSVNGTGSYTLADKLTSNGLLRISSGVFNSNNMDVTVGALSLTGGQLAMGNSQWNLTGFYLGYAWAVAGANNVNAGTSTINVLLNFAPKFGGGNNKYHIVTAANPTFFESGNFDVIRPSAAGATFGSITIYDSLSLYPGGNYYFVKGGTVSFADTAVFYARGTASQMINLESTQAGTQYTLMKNTGLVCTDFLNLYDSRATGTSIFTAGANTIDRGNNSGWDFSPYPAAGNGSLTGGIKCGGSPYMLRFDISAGSYPMDIILRNLNTGKRDTLFGVTSSPAYFAVSPSATNNFQVQAIIVNRCSQVVTGPFNTVAVNVPVGVLGQWTNAAGTNDWFDCRNWGNGIVPDSFTNVVISSVGASNIAAQGAECNNVTINTGGQLALTNANASIAIHGTITNSGLFNASNGRVELAGAAAQTIPPSVNVFDSLVINNRSTTGVNLSGNDVTVKKTLLLLTGKVNTGVKLINVTNTAGAAVAGHSTASYVNGNLKRSITATGSFDFPVGSSTQYQLATFNSNAITGVSDITARFDPFVSIPTDTMLPPLYYTTTGEYAHGLLDHGYWTLNPNAPMTGGNYDVVLQARGYTNPAAQQFRYIMVKKDAGSGFLWDINQGYNDPSTQQQTASVVTTKRSSYTSFSNFAIAKLDALGTLGVNLISFTGTALSGGSNTINWTTDKSASGMYFMLERSSNGTAFSVVSLIKASENAAGNKYHFTDKDAGSGTVYYRLKVSQQDGSSFYSKIIKLRSTEETAIRVTPMPSARKVEVDINGSTADEQFVFQMIDNQGRQLIYLPIQAGHSSVQTGNFPDGIYVVKIIRTKHPAFIKRISWNRQ
ncbi:MAG TPA: hypothetical protein VL307_03855, partial [Chitinophagaceae bacterium]|nr:hypothetical protein [Chitinophagaceae bacterium]